MNKREIAVNSIQITVNLTKNKATIKNITRISIFENNIYVIESDLNGFSALELRNGDIYFMNVLNGKTIDERKITEKEAKDIIRSAIEYKLYNKV